MARDGQRGSHSGGSAGEKAAAIQHKDLPVGDRYTTGGPGGAEKGSRPRQWLNLNFSALFAVFPLRTQRIKSPFLGQIIKTLTAECAKKVRKERREIQIEPPPRPHKVGKLGHVPSNYLTQGGRITQNGLGSV